MAYGIDSQIQDRVDAYRGNPQQLMQRYQQNQELLDLLALQKLKSEKEAAARDMQMQMQQNPQTIKQQREAELLGLTKQELAQQTQGILQQRQASQQKNLQRVAQGGLGALAPQRPMPRMAGGGVVAFQAGGLSEMGGLYGVTQEEIDAYRRSRRGQAARGLYGLTDADIARRISESRSGAGQIPMSTGERLRANRTGVMPSDIGRPAGVPADYEPGTIAAIGPEGAGPKPIPMADTPLQRGPATRAPISDRPIQYGPQNPRRGGIADLPVAPATDVTPVDEEIAEATSVEPATGAGIGGGLGAMQQGFDISDRQLGRQEKADKYAEMEAELRALDEKQSDPRRRRERRLTEFLLGAGGRTSAAGALAGGARASLRFMDREEAQDRQRLKDIISMAERGMDLDTRIGAEGVALGKAMYQEYMATKRTMMNNIAAMDREQLKQMAQRVKDAQAQANSDRTYQLEVDKFNELAAQARRDDMRLSGVQAMNVVESVQRMHGSLRDSWLQNNPEFQQLQIEMMALEGADRRAAADRVAQLTQQAEDEAWGALDRPLEGAQSGTPTPLDLYEKALESSYTASQGVLDHSYSE